MVKQRTALGKETNGDCAGKRTREEEEEGGALEGDTEAAIPHAQKKLKAAKQPTLLHICDAEIDILRSILGYIRSRFAYLRLGFTCKQFAQHHHPNTNSPSLVYKVYERRMVFNLRPGTQHFCDIKDSDASSFDWAVTWMTDDDDDELLERLRDCPLGTLELMCRLFSDGNPEPVEALSDFFLWEGQRNGLYFNITTKTRSNMFSVGDRLKLLTLRGITRLYMEATYGAYVSMFEGLDSRQRGVTGTIWWKFTPPDGGHLTDCFPFESLFEFEELQGDPGVTVFKHCTVKVDLDGSWTRVPVKVDRITWREELDLTGHLDVTGGPKLKAKIHEISWEYKS
ncbi:hypothetical protein HK104_002250 [Borealophlyctis nickersoniae]|nr:hypothetical protein HK104_002250 [Borealophlyctis nickersoniae]